MTIRRAIRPLGGGIRDPYKKETVLFESASPGSYNLNISGDGVYLVYCIGGGGGGRHEIDYDRNSMKSRSSGGGSGAGFIGELLLEKGNLPITIGAGGGENNGGGASKIGSIITAGGGASNYTSNSSGGPGGGGGAISVNSAYFATTPQLQTNGNSGIYQYTHGNPLYANGGASVWGGYGAGGPGPSSAGSAGYVKIVYKRLK